MADKFLICFGSVFGGRALAYGKVDQSRLPDEVKVLLVSYRHVVMTLCASFLLPLFFMKPVTVLLSVPLVALSFLLKKKYETRLDPLLAPYMRGDAP